MKNLIINQTDFTFAVTEKFGLAVPYATAGDCFSASSEPCRRGNFKIDLSGTGLRVDNRVSWSLVSNTQGLQMQDFTNYQGIVIGARCGGWCGHCRPNGPLKLDLVTCKVRTSESLLPFFAFLTLAKACITYPYFTNESYLYYSVCHHQYHPVDMFAHFTNAPCSFCLFCRFCPCT